MNIGFIGCGIYPLSLTNIINKNIKITMWSKFKEETDTLKEKYPHINFTNNLEDLKNKDLIIIAIPSIFIEETLKEYKKYYNNEKILVVSKGILENGKFISDIIENTLKQNNISVMSGPTFAVDVNNTNPLGFTLSSKNTETINIIKNIFNNNNTKIEIINDLIGIELLGAIKNVIAISTGIIEGLNYKESTKYKYITDIIKTLPEILSKLNANPNTLYTYAGIGDLLMTSTSIKSRNYNFGLIIGKKENWKDYLKNNTTEGYTTLESIYTLFQNKKININFINNLYNIIYNNEPLDTFIELLKK